MTYVVGLSGHFPVNKHEFNIEQFCAFYYTF